ncbi:mannitol-specific PTS transporter subunit IIC [Demequina capsici]|uniref:Mannitol-specific PTS transporter subunit IIC n=1 Tax=Demequina capsici TaxID=3075620 RepID=A0AA96F995_9MICO|nr:MULTISPECIES: mannitol-specific PTS transporter subunit IIC [unclassified Demequina]WNM25157.1 mannitol-specific PTS transporter subunit IIC [Demequina sp. OYTSA14]WNM28064.1 mannitol-specific PTS transporter subunit IIC [Demequina sp. PMTSA13]
MSLPDAQVNKNRDRGVGAAVQKFGRFLSGMIMPNIGAFIAWGLITALFIPTGWIPNSNFAELVGPMITYLLPLLIGYTGGKMVHETRGAVIGSIATMGVIMGAFITIDGEQSQLPMFMGAMLMGPFAAWVLKQFDKLIEGKVKAGFEMLIDNFSIGIIGMLLAMLGKIVIGPIVAQLVEWAGNGVDFLVSHHLLPLASLIVEPGKVLFLNNAINHGVFTPLGTQQVVENGKSILFMIESNPGPGLGILAAFLFFGPKMLRASVPGAMIIHFLGGIHEIYFPYVLMKPKMIVAAIAGGMSGVATGVLFNNGLVSAPSPGSIFSWIAFTPKGEYPTMFLQVLVAAAVAFAVGFFLLKFDKELRQEAKEEAEAEAAEESTVAV